MRSVAGLRRRWRLTSLPQLDLLFPARRLWRHRLPDCSLGTLEATLLGVRREALDISGAEIPGIYLDYLRTGRTEGIRRIVYHNAQDVLSLVGLAAQVPADPWARREALSGYTMLLKGAGRRAEAISGWNEWGSLAPEDPTPAIELAKYYEWHERDYRQARLWAEREKACLATWPVDWRRHAMEAAIRHRLARLSRKSAIG